MLSSTLITFALLDLTVSAECTQFSKAAAFRRQNGIDLPLGALTEDSGRRSEGRSRAHQILIGTLPVRVHLAQIVAVVMSTAEQVTDFVGQRLTAFCSGSFIATKPGSEQANV